MVSKVQDKSEGSAGTKQTLNFSTQVVKNILNVMVVGILLQIVQIEGLSLWLKIIVMEEKMKLAKNQNMMMMRKRLLMLTMVSLLYCNIAYKCPMWSRMKVE